MLRLLREPEAAAAPRRPAPGAGWGAVLVSNVAVRAGAAGLMRFLKILLYLRDSYQRHWYHLPTLVLLTRRTVVQTYSVQTYSTNEQRWYIVPTLVQL